MDERGVRGSALGSGTVLKERRLPWAINVLEEPVLFVWRHVTDCDRGCHSTSRLFFICLNEAGGYSRGALREAWSFPKKPLDRGFPRWYVYVQDGSFVKLLSLLVLIRIPRGA